jgi:hypothetical protein
MLVMRGLDPRIHLKKVDCRVEPGNDELGITIDELRRLRSSQ